MVLIRRERETKKRKEGKKVTGPTGRDKEEGKRKEKWKRKIGNKKEIHYLFLEIMIHKLYWVIEYCIMKNGMKYNGSFFVNQGLY
jgi:hypothetical protein